VIIHFKHKSFITFEVAPMGHVFIIVGFLQTVRTYGPWRYD